jgi:nucleoside-diphosphate-sugar epimerase
MIFFYSPIYQRLLLDTIPVLSNLDDLRNKSVAVTGATGLIGSTLVDLLRVINKEKSLNIKIFALGRSIEKLKICFESGAEFVQHDILEEFNFSTPVDFVVHAAGNSNPIAYSQNPVETLIGNVEGTYRLLKYAKEADVKKIIYISSGEVYGNLPVEEMPITEEKIGKIDFMKPRSSYSESKRATENLVISFAHEYGLNVSIVRPSHVIGTNFTGSDNRVSAEFFRLALSGKDITLKSDGLNKRSYCFSSDVASGILTVLLHGRNAEAYNITNTENVISIRELARRIAEKTAVKLIFDLPTQEDLDRRTLIIDAVLDDTKLRSLGWKPIVSIDGAIDKIIRILSKNNK